MDIVELHYKLCSIKKAQIKKSELARALKFSREYIGQLFKSKKELTVDKIEQIESYFNVNLKENISETVVSAIDNLENLKTIITDEEFQKLKELLEGDKELIFLLYRAWKGDFKAFKALEVLIKEVNDN